MSVLSLNFRSAAYPPESGVFPIALLTLDVGSEIIRLSADPTQRLIGLTTPQEVVYGTASRGNDYIFLPLTIKLPDDTDDGPGQMRIEIDNVNRGLTQMVRSIDTPIPFHLELVMSNALDVVEIQWPEFLLTGLVLDESKISGVLHQETLEHEPFPAGTMTPAGFPGLF